MATRGLEFRIDDANLQRWLANLRTTVSDFTLPFQRLNVYVEGRWREGFNTGGQSLGERWAPLAESTKRNRLRARGGNRGGVNRPLWDFGDLRRTLVFPGPNSIRVIKPQEFVRGTSDRRAAIHQKGTNRAGVNRNVRIPARPMITKKLRTQVRDEAKRLIESHVRGRLG